MMRNRWIKQLIIFAAVVGLLVPALAQAADNVVMYPKISSFVLFLDPCRKHISHWENQR